MIYLVHHADAVGPEVDPQRPLSAGGRTHAERLARAAAARGIKPAVIWHSGKLRARQTAEPFRSACNPFADVAAVRGLQPTDPPGWIADSLAGEQRDVMLVGHMPNLQLVLTLLLTRDESSTVAFPPHGLVALEYANGEWHERWRLTI
jgi:phosphohistidine phosphatase